MKIKNYPSWLVPIDIAKKLKEIGFNTNTIFLYNKEEEPKVMFGLNTFEEVNGQSNLEIEQLCFYQEADMESYECILPTWEQVLEWFRRKGLFHSICFTEDLIEKVKGFEIEIRDNNADIICILHQETYEEAREAAINKLIEIYKQDENRNNI